MNDIRVLVVDDDFMVARVNQGLVDQAGGYTVVGQAYNGESALRVAERLRPDLVLLDIYLPDISGLEVLRRFRGLPGAAVDVIAVTASRDAETIRAAMRGGVVHYLIKPFTPEALWERLTLYRQAHRRLSSTVQFGQSDVDRVFGVGRGTEALPKGLTARTCQVIEEILRAADGELSASQCAAEVGLSRVSARRYLEYLVDRGKAEVRPRYGATGRPERLYRWTRPGPGPAAAGG
ncbi:response regulator of citrate/malate metabolism [Murinocardiopsis flavida]|uniref:Transcriptional regulatory protein n=1 Tax=Murinocardiopsis flavida TaxID=645275 RepID=A0A2P8DRW5_9ACTN|nr:response regulator [Murinocardiopsis flavida]PSK99924.1 response regulator of citrate/malate metabolism [Murinocardiopsis flavida]